MSRFYFTLALLVALFSSSVTAETIVYDSLEEVDLSLPTAGGNPVNKFNYPNGHGVSPYCINVAVNDGNTASPDGSHAGEAEQFYFSDDNAGMFGQGSLINQSYSASFGQTAGDVKMGSGRQYLGSESSPVTTMGLYSYCFTIPAQSSLIFNITYMQTATVASGVSPVTELIEVVIQNGDSAVTGDPQFVGLRGQSYQVHGIDGAVYNIISEEDTQVNSRFVFLTEGQCPMLNGKPDTNCWSHPGSYLGEMSFQAVVDGKVHAALIQSGAAATGYAGVQVDGKALAVGDMVAFGAFSVEYVSTHLVAVSTSHYSFQLSNSDHFINQALRATVPLSKLTSHGLLGQTHSTQTYATALKYIQGEVDDYVVQDGNIYGTDFLYNKFNL